MTILTRIGVAAVSLSLLVGVVQAQEEQEAPGYQDVRVGSYEANCGTIVLMWPNNQEEHPYDPDPGRDDPKLDMAEVTPLPVIHHHPALNAGQLYMPPQDGFYRHYFPESEGAPRLQRWNRDKYEAFVRDQNPSTDVPLAVRMPVVVTAAPEFLVEKMVVVPEEKAPETERVEMVAPLMKLDPAHPFFAEAEKLTDGSIFVTEEMLKAQPAE